MKQQTKTLRRGFVMLVALLMLASFAGCSLTDPVIHVGTPSPSATEPSQPTETAAQQTPTVAPSATPDTTALPSATPEEANGAGAYTITADTNESQKTYYSEKADENALRVENSAQVSIDGAQVQKRTGDASSLDNTMTYGLNAALLVHAGAQIDLINADILSTPLGAGGAFVYGGTLRLQNSTIRSTGASSISLGAGEDGSVTAQEVNLSSAGNLSPAIYAASGADVSVTGGMITTGGQQSPAVSASGSVTISCATLRANSAAAIAVNGGSVSLTDSAVSGRMSDLILADVLISPYCVALYRDRNAGSKQSAFSMKRGALTAFAGDLFYVPNTSATIDLEGVALTPAEGKALLWVSGNDGTRGWGEAGSNGADCTLTATDQTLTGDVVVDEHSSVTLVLRSDSTYSGTVNTANTARAAKVTLENGSTWSLTGNAYLTAFSGRVSSITTNGFAVYVNGTLLTN